MRPLLFLAFVVVPLTELAIIVQVQRAVGLDWTLLALLAISVVGAVLVKREGTKAWQRFSEALGSGRMPTTEVVDGALLLVAGALLLTPGFLTDAVGVVFLVPLTRGLVNRALRARGRAAVGLGPAGNGDGANDTVDVEVVDVRRTDGDDDAPELGTGSPDGRG